MEDKMLVSIYDSSGRWAKPYADAGWKVLLWDKQHEGCILENFNTLCRWIDKNLEGQRLTGLLAAPPCTDTSGSGARWWEEKDKGERWWQGEGPNGKLTQYFENTTERTKALIRIVLVLVERYNPHFWSMEQPVGRAEKLCPELEQYRKLTFQPWWYGDPYTKRTILWGEFNAELPKNPVEPTEGSKMHKVPPGPERKKIRSQTPEGFAQAFYQANHKQVTKQMTLL